ncbi:hypothetical protein HBB16_07730 [Pseudonocardia sp. MCCB 268]|nr:hypothetical protein [Pseudonocardia cytotoxica]
MSLYGQVDFHALDAVDDRRRPQRHPRGLLMISNDGGRTAARSCCAGRPRHRRRSFRPIPHSRHNRGTAWSQPGGGSTFRGVAGGPLLAFVSWADDGTVAAGSDRTERCSSTDRGATGSDAPVRESTAGHLTERSDPADRRDRRRNPFVRPTAPHCTGSP